MTKRSLKGKLGTYDTIYDLPPWMIHAKKTEITFYRSYFNARVMLSKI